MTATVPNGEVTTLSNGDSSTASTRLTATVLVPPLEKKQAKISLVVPAMNEAKNIAWVLIGVPDIVDEILLVDGNSTDGTVEVAQSVRPDVRVVADPGGGKGAALRAGFEAATGDYIVMMDADGSMDPSEIGRYVAMLDNGYELVKGSRFMEGAGSTDITPLRNLGNWALLRLLNTLFRVHLTDLCYGYCAFRRDCLPQMFLSTDGFEIETEITVQAMNSQLRVCEVPSMETERGHGQSNLNTFGDGQRVLRVLIAGWLTPGRKSRRPDPDIDLTVDSVAHR